VWCVKEGVIVWVIFESIVIVCEKDIEKLFEGCVGCYLKGLAAIDSERNGLDYVMEYV